MELLLSNRLLTDIAVDFRPTIRNQKLTGAIVFSTTLPMASLHPTQHPIHRHHIRRFHPNQKLQMKNRILTLFLLFQSHLHTSKITHSTKQCSRLWTPVPASHSFTALVCRQAVFLSVCRQNKRPKRPPAIFISTNVFIFPTCIFLSSLAHCASKAWPRWSLMLPANTT